MTLDEQLRALCEEHNLICLDVGFTRYRDGEIRATASCQAVIDPTRPDVSENRYCTFGDAGTTNELKWALASAIEKLNEKRAKVPVVPTLEAA